MSQETFYQWKPSDWQNDVGIPFSIRQAACYPSLTTLQCDDGREISLLNHIHSHPSINLLRNNPGAIVEAIDEFARKQDFLMTIGPAKRQIVTEIMASTDPKPKIFLEFGAYVGYSAIALASALRDLHPNAPPGSIRYLTFDNMPYWAAITSSLIELAGLKDIVEVVVGNVEDSLRRLHSKGKLAAASVDMILVDHYEKFYVPDLQVCEELGLLRNGSVVLADNVLRPGAPEYLDYVKAGKALKSKEELEYVTRSVDSIMPNGWKVCHQDIKNTCDSVCYKYEAYCSSRIFWR